MVSTYILRLGPHEIQLGHAKWPLDALKIRIILLLLYLLKMRVVGLLAVLLALLFVGIHALQCNKYGKCDGCNNES